MKTTKQLQAEAARAEWHSTLASIAEEHRKADKRCGREWECSCGACRIIRSELAIIASARPG